MLNDSSPNTRWSSRPRDMLTAAEQYEALAELVYAKAHEFGEAHIRGLGGGDTDWRILNANRAMELALYGYASSCVEYATGLRVQAAGKEHFLLVRPTPITELLKVTDSLGSQE